MDIKNKIKEFISSDKHELDLSNSGLNEIPEEIFNLQKIETLKLMHNKIKFIPEDIVKLKSLKNLYLYDNEISSIPEKLLINMPYLNCFDIADNPLDYNQVSKFYYDNNQWKGYQECLRYIDEFKNKDTPYDYDKKIFWYNNPVRRFPKEIFELKELEELYFGGIEVETIPSGLSNLSNLKRLGLSNNKLKDLPEDIVHLHNLESITLDNNSFSTFPKIIFEIPNIKEVSIINNNIEYVDFNKVHKFLDCFVISHNPISKDKWFYQKPYDS